MTQSRLDQELLALEIFGFLCRSEVFSWVIATSVGGLAEVCCWRQSRLDFAHRKYCGSWPWLCGNAAALPWFSRDSAGEAERRFVEQADRGQWTLLPECLNPLAMRQRRETVEHPFGTMNARMGRTHFLTRTLPKVAAEMALSVLAWHGSSTSSGSSRWSMWSRP